MSQRQPMDSSEHTRRLQWDVTGWLADHELLGEDYWDGGRGARWCIGRPDSFIHRCEIIAGIGGSLLVHGDFDSCRFANYGDVGDAWHRLLWMADCTDLGYYVAQKAAIGMADRNAADSFSSQVAVHDLKQRITEAQEDGSPKDLVELLRDALLGHSDDQHELQRFLNDGDRGWDLWEWEVGRIVASRVVVSHAALRRTAALLRERHGREGPPECRMPNEPGAFPRKGTATAPDGFELVVNGVARGSTAQIHAGDDLVIRRV